jgi:hypothetical protein
MARTQAPLVRGVLDRDYDLANMPDLSPYIDTASMLIDQVAVCASKKGIVYTGKQLELLERWVSAYCYTRMDPIYQSKSTEGASGQFVTEPNPDIGPERYKAMAIQLDYSGCLNALFNRKSTQNYWLGKPPSQQIPIWQRD